MYWTLRIAFAATGGPLSLEPLQALAAEHRIVAVVRPATRGPWWRRVARRAQRAAGWRPRDRVADWSRASGVPTILAASGTDERLAEGLRRHAPDLLCIASFPWRLSRQILALPPAGVLNLHPSLLPRHRGPNPFFWTYWQDDRVTGVTVHVATERVDAGSIVAQWDTPLARGTPVEEWYRTAAREGARLLRDAVREWEAGRARLVLQDETRTTAAPPVRPGTSMVDFAAWDVERVWHFLAGLVPRFYEPLRDDAGVPIRYRGIAGFERCPPAAPSGSVEVADAGWILWCRDGCVRLTSR